MVYKILLGLLFVINSYAQFDFNDLKSLESDFTQTVFNPSKKEIVYKGKLFINIDGKVLWQYKTPIIKSVYLIDNSVIIDEPELEQAIYTTLEDSIDFIKLLKNAKKIDNYQYKTTIKDIDYNILVNNNNIESISYKDTLGNSVIIKLDNSKVNVKLDDEIFKFLPPEYYDIIKK
jgi:outer membrane lipoprotein carrier protein